MTKRRKSKDLVSESPLTASTSKATKGNSKCVSSSSQKRARKEAKEDAEERQLTDLLFGNLTKASEDPFDTDYNAAVQEENSEEGFVFEIDRSGTSQGKLENAPTDEDDKNVQQKILDNSSVDNDTAVWEDPDDVGISLLDSSHRLKKLRKSRSETEKLGSTEIEGRLRKRYEQSTQASARTDWAKSTEANRSSEDDIAAELFSTSASLLATSRNRLPPNVLSVVRCPDANQEDPSKAVVRAVNFHPGSDPDQPLLLTAGLDKTLRFFQVGPEKSEKIHGIHFPKMPIYSASFLGSTGNVVVSGRRPFFYIYDAVAGKVDLVPQILGREEKSWERHQVSPDGRLIAFVGNDGYIVLVDSHTKQGIGSFKLNGSVRAVTFTPDCCNIVASGSDGDVYRWDIRSRKCLERFSNNDGTISASLAASEKCLAVGAESGVVNIYSEHDTRPKKTPLRSVMNLHTAAECLRFNHDGQILAMSSRREQHGLKLLHVPTKTVFSNWPTSKTPLKYVWSLDFSPKSKFMAVGNDKGKCLLYRLNHYSE